MRIPGFIIAVIFITSCSSNSSVGKQLSGSDSLVINFNKPQTDSIEKTMTTTDSKAIQKLSGFVNSKTAAAYKCTYDGNMMFYIKGKLLGDVAFNYSGDGCKHFILSIDDKLTATTMNNEAVEFLKSLADGKGWY